MIQRGGRLLWGNAFTSLSLYIVSLPLSDMRKKTLSDVIKMIKIADIISAAVSESQIVVCLLILDHEKSTN